MNRIKRIFRRDNILVVLLILAAVLGLFNIPQSIGISTEQVILALLGILALDTLAERIGYLERIESKIFDIENKLNPSISVDKMFGFRTEIPAFSKLLENSNEVWFAGKTASTIITTYGRQIEKFAREGKKLRFIMANPNNEALVSVYAFSSFTRPDATEARQLIRDTLAHLERIQENTATQQIEARLSAYPDNWYTVGYEHRDSSEAHTRSYPE